MNSLLCTEHNNTYAPHTTTHNYAQLHTHLPHARHVLRRRDDEVALREAPARDERQVGALPDRHREVARARRRREAAVAGVLGALLALERGDLRLVDVVLWWRRCLFSWEGACLQKAFGGAGLV